MQNTHSHTELDTVPPPSPWKCHLGKFRSSLLYGAYQMHRFRRPTTWCRLLTRTEPFNSPWQTCTSNEIQPFKSSHLPRTDFELCILDTIRFMYYLSDVNVLWKFCELLVQSLWFLFWTTPHDWVCFYDIIIIIIIATTHGWAYLHGLHNKIYRNTIQ